MIIFKRIGKKYFVINVDEDGCSEHYPSDREPTSFTKCWNSSKVREWLPDEFKIEEL